MGLPQPDKDTRLRDRLEDIDLAVRIVPRVPFTNNQDKQDVPMTKRKHRISDCFRSVGGTDAFGRICRFAPGADADKSREEPVRRKSGVRTKELQ